MALIDRVKNILVTPKTEWSVIAGESPSVQSLYVGYILILAAIGPIAVAVRFGLFGMGLGTALISYVIGLVMIYLLAWVVDALAPSFGGEKNFIKSLQLTAYSFTAAWVAGIFHLIPGVGGLLALAAAIYSFYTFYLGVPILKKCPQEKAAVYTIVVVLCAIVLGGVLSYVLFSALMGGGMMGTMGAGMMQ
jgi:Yip1-like protein